MYCLDGHGTIRVWQVLRQVDFDQLKIENQQFLDRIEEKNNTMIQLKLLAGRSLHELNQQKRKLLVRSHVLH